MTSTTKNPEAEPTPTPTRNVAADIATAVASVQSQVSLDAAMPIVCQPGEGFIDNFTNDLEEEAAGVKE